MAVHTICRHLRQSASLRANAGHKQEIIGTELPNLLKLLRSGCAHHKHKVISASQAHRVADYPLKERLSRGARIVRLWLCCSRGACLVRLCCRGAELQGLVLLCGGVGGHCQHYGPLLLILQEGGNGVAAHIGSKSNSVARQVLIEGLGIHLCSVANIAALGIRYDKDIGIILLNIPYSLLKLLPAGSTVGLVEGAIRLVSHGIGRSCIYYCLVKMKERVLLGAARLRHLLQHRVQSNAEETPLL